MVNISYKGFDITFNFYRKGEYTVYYDGDDVWFETEEDAKAFIDEIIKKESEVN